MRHGYEHFPNLVKISLTLIIAFFSCGRADALPQDWPCDDITLTKVSKNSFQGDNGEYQIRINSFDDTVDHQFIYNCGNAGCLGTITHLETGKHETARFDCLFDAEKKKMTCSIISGDEYVLTKVSDNEYRVRLCREFDKFIYLTECGKCTCILHDSRGKQVASDYEMNCTRENMDKLHCYTEEAYNWAHKYKNDSKDYENCVGLTFLKTAGIGR